jgi:ABC-type transporter Mla MlaB component
MYGLITRSGTRRHWSHCCHRWLWRSWRHARGAEGGRLAPGRVDLSGPADVQALFEVCRRRLARGDEPLELDLTGVLDADTKLLACLVALHRAARVAGRRLTVRVSPVIEQWVRVCKLDGVLADVVGAAEGRRE